MKKAGLSFLGLLLIWQLIYSTKQINPMFLASPSATLQEGIVLFTQKKLVLDLGYTIKRIFEGVFLAALVGIPIGLLAGFFNKLYPYMDTIFDFFRSIPPILVFPLLLLLFGSGDESRVAVVWFGCTAILLFSSAQAANRVSDIRLNSAKIMGAKWYQILLRVVFFDSLPSVFVGIRMAISMGIIITIVTEMLVGTKYGLGSRAIDAQMSYEIPELFFIIIMVGVLGMVTNQVLYIVERKLIHWKDKN